MASPGERLSSVMVVAALLASAGAARAEEPRPFVVADLADRSTAGLAVTYGRSECDECVEAWPELTATIYTLFADWSVRPGLKLWASLPVVQRHREADSEFVTVDHTAFGQLVLGARQMWSAGGAWQPRWSAGASFAGTPRSGAGGEAGVTMDAARLVSGAHPSQFSVDTTTTRLHGDAAVSRGRFLAQLGLSLLARSPDEREIRAEVAFEALVGVRLHSRVALLAETTGSFFDASVLCQSTCRDSHGGFTQVVSGNVGVRATLPHAFVGARLIVPLTDDRERYSGGMALPRSAISLAVSLEAGASF